MDIYLKLNFTDVGLSEEDKGTDLADKALRYFGTRFAQAFNENEVKSIDSSLGGIKILPEQFAVVASCKNTVVEQLPYGFVDKTKQDALTKTKIDLFDPVFSVE